MKEWKELCLCFWSSQRTDATGDRKRNTFIHTCASSSHLTPLSRLGVEAELDFPCQRQEARWEEQWRRSASCVWSDKSTSAKPSDGVKQVMKETRFHSTVGQTEGTSNKRIHISHTSIFSLCPIVPPTGDARYINTLICFFSLLRGTSYHSDQA